MIRPPQTYRKDTVQYQRLGSFNIDVLQGEDSAASERLRGVRRDVKHWITIFKPNPPMKTDAGVALVIPNGQLLSLIWMVQHSQGV